MRNEHTPVEVEVKIPVSDPEDIIRRLEQCRFRPAVTCREEDVYYNSDLYDLKEHDKALRIRRVTDLATGKTRAEFNCKDPKVDQVEGLGYEQKNTIRNSYLSMMQKKEKSGKGGDRE